MKLEDILDMKEYLDHRCYCPGEIYSSDGFFYQIFKPEQECKIIGENKDFLVVVATPYKLGETEDLPQIIVIIKSEDEPAKVDDTTRFDATENNISFFTDHFGGLSLEDLKKNGRKLDEYKPGATAKSLSEIFSIADAIMVSKK